MLQEKPSSSVVAGKAKTRGKRLFTIASVTLALLLIGQAALYVSPADAATQELSAQYYYQDKRPAKRISLQDLGVLQVAAHDLYRVNRQTGVDTEDERFNLSTLFAHGEENIAIGGENRNSENIATRSVAIFLGQYYLKLVERGVDEDRAKERTVKLFLTLLRGAYERTFDERFPRPAADGQQQQGNRLNGDLALRTLHGFLPGTIKVNGEKISIFDPTLADQTLSWRELQQLSRPLDDSFDPAFRAIVIGVDANGNPITFDLFERDSTFAEQFDTDFTFEELFSDLSDGRYNRNDEALKLIRADFAEGQRR
jgi:hypothetical protein